jgi:hypothetical protein
MYKNKRTVEDIGMPKTLKGEKDKRYTDPQILKNNGQRDFRCNTMKEKKSK